MGGPHSVCYGGRPSERTTEVIERKREREIGNLRYQESIIEGLLWNIKGRCIKGVDRITGAPRHGADSRPDVGHVLSTS